MSPIGFTFLMLLGLMTAQFYPPAFPREGATKILENDRVIVWKIVWERQKRTPMHRHGYDQLFVPLSEGKAKVTRADGSVFVTETTRIGQPSFQAKGVIHSEEGLSDGRAIIVELKDQQLPLQETNSGSPSPLPSEGDTVLMDNERVSVWDYTWKPETSVPLYIRGRDTVMIVIETGTLRSTAGIGLPEIALRSSGDAFYFARNYAHPLEAINSSPRAVFIELK